jgi:1-acyl-sn-glycerol-3-phosphate acyltransferase
MTPPSLAARSIKRAVLTAVGAGSFWHLGVRNSLFVGGREHLENLPDSNVLFVANHQTWFLDVIAIYHALTRPHASPLAGVRAPIHVSFIAANETMNRRGLLPKFFAAGGAVCIKRTWRDGDQEVSRPVEKDDLTNIAKALNEGWVFTFPQGTTKVGAPGRRGTAHLICAQKPVVVPVVLSGFRDAFDKSGLVVRNPGTKLSVRFAAPLAIDHAAGIDRVLAQVMDAIGESPAQPLDAAAPAGQDTVPLEQRAGPAILKHSAGTDNVFSAHGNPPQAANPR